jgi:DNA-binding GntR family transcriptional regulator
LGRSVTAAWAGDNSTPRDLNEAAVSSLATAEAVVRRIVADHYDRPSLVSSIASKIGAEIIAGYRRPGDDLNTVDLSISYQTSRTPVREALMLLEKERLVEIPPRRRPRVATLSLEEIAEIYVARAALLEIVAANVASHASDAQLEELRGIVERMEAASRSADLDTYLWLNIAFHDLNTQLGRNLTVKRIVESLLLRTLPLRRFSLAQPGGMQHSAEDHIQLIRAYENRDPHLSAAVIRSNHYSALARIEKNYNAFAAL